jgi:LDH2 family malate/lactate/ureidoglycolate dehydrogenase
MVSALLGGLSMIDDPDPTLIGAPALPDAETRGRIAGVFLIAIDPNCFGNGQHYQGMVSQTISVAKNVSPAPGVNEILIPGEPEVRARELREREGIPLPDAVWRDLAQASDRFGVPLPEDVSAR